jgi:glycosyltransferase involved in cell wall biosynthesis
MTVLLVRTAGEGSMDRCGRLLAQRLPVPDLEVPLPGTSAGAFGVAWSSRASLRGVAGDRALLRRLRARPEVPHFVHHHLARFGPRLRRPYLVTAHDLIRWTDLTGTDPLISRPTRRDGHYVRRDVDGIRSATAVIAVSRTTRRELIARLGLDPARIAVVPHGLDHALFRPVERRLVDGPYVLFVGSEHPRKNLVGLLEAFALLRRDRPGLRLVKVGAPGDSEAEFGAPTRRALDRWGLADAVHLTGEVSDADLVAYYSGARCLVLPSRAEGFGLPVLEAMACGCPVVASTAGALPEVVGDAGAVVDPGDVRTLVAAVGRLLDDPVLRARYRDAGLRRAAAFSWEGAAAETARVYDRVC